MSGFDLGEGWRQVAEEDIRLGDAVISYASEYGADPTWWVRVPAVPPLPTEPYTVIRVQWRPETGRPALGDPGIRTLFPDGTWSGWSVANLLERITGFEVLAEPRAVTAKAVLDRVLHLDSWSDGIPIRNIEALARELGVSS